MSTDTHVHLFRPWSNRWQVCLCGKKQPTGTIYADPDLDSQRADSKPQSPVCDEPLGAGEIPGEGSRRDPRIQVQVRSFRRRLLDEDNLISKYAVDGLRYCQLIPDDCPGLVTISTSQTKVRSKEDERTEITLKLEEPARQP